MRVLILDAASSGSYHAMRSLARAGHHVSLVATASSPWLRSKYCSAPMPIDRHTYRDESAYVAGLIATLAKAPYDLMLCCGDRQAEYVHRHRSVIEEYVQRFVARTELMEAAFDKRAAYRLASDAGLAIPRTRDPASLDEAVRIADELSYPVVVKGPRGSASSDVRFATGPAALVAELQALQAKDANSPRLAMIQEYVDGPGFVVHMLFSRGTPVAVCCHRKDRELPTLGGVTSAATTVNDPRLVATALGFGKALGWNGLLKLDLKLDSRSGVYKFIEMDARVSASIDIARVSGADQILMLAELARGKPVGPVLECKSGIRYRWLFPRDLSYVMTHASLMPGLLADVFRHDTHFDLGLDDWRVTARAAYRFLRSLPQLSSRGEIASDERRALELRKVLESTR